MENVHQHQENLEMATYDPKERIWTHIANPKEDVIPMGSYLGESVLEKLRSSEPNRILEYNHETEQKRTVKEILESTLTVAENLKDLNLGPNDTLAFFSRHNSYISSIVFGCYLNGTAWSPFDIDHVDLDYFLDYIKPTIFIYDDDFRNKAEESLSHLEFNVKHVLIFGNPSAKNSVENVLLKPREIENFTPKDLSIIGSAENLVACIPFTSGSTGKPKAVLLTHSMFVNTINAAQGLEGFNNAQENIISASGICWITQLWMMFIPVFFGSTKTFSGQSPDPVNLCSVIHKWKVTTIIVTNSLIQATLDHYFSTPGYDFSSFKNIMIGGEAPCASMNAKFKKILPHAKIIQGYGITECAGAIANQSDLNNMNGGHLLRGISVRVVDERGKNVGPDTLGMVYIQTRAPFLGYYQREEANKESYHNGWYITGDCGYMTIDNHLHIYCRFKDIPKCNGKLIIPNIVEEHLNKHAMVDRGMMTAVPGPDSGNQRIAIFIKLVKGVTEGRAKQEIIPYMKELIDWNIVAKLKFVDQLKMLPNGKADREILKRELVL